MKIHRRNSLLETNTLKLQCLHYKIETNILIWYAFCTSGETIKHLNQINFHICIFLTFNAKTPAKKHTQNGKWDDGQNEPSNFVWNNIRLILFSHVTPLVKQFEHVHLRLKTSSMTTHISHNDIIIQCYFIYLYPTLSPIFYWTCSQLNC